MLKEVARTFVALTTMVSGCAGSQGEVPGAAPASADVAPPAPSAASAPVLDLEALRSTSVLAWSQEQKEYGFGRMQDFFPTRPIKRGTPAADWPRAESLRVTFDVGGDRWSLDDYVARNLTAGLLVILDGKVVYENYGLGHSADGRWTSFSVAKSLTSTLVGAAIKDGFIKSVDDPVTRYLPQLKGSGYDGVTIAQMLTMTSGVQWDEDYTDPKSDVSRFLDEPSRDGSDPTVTYMARLNRANKPGTVWKYKTGESNLIGSLVSAATGKTLSDYLSEKIWAPVGMAQDGAWILNSGKREIAGCCISASLRDFGRFGEFFMNGAEVNGEAIVPDGWVEEATRATETADDVTNYGYQWWIGRDGAYRASGIFGQGIWINPKLKLVVVTQSAWDKAVDREAGRRRWKMISAIEEAITQSVAAQ